jgi:hypothetical protein
MLQSEVVRLSEKNTVTCQIDIVSDSEIGMEDLLKLKDAYISFESLKNKLNNGYQDSQACLLHPSNSRLRFPVPTAHIYGGRKDQYFELSKALIELGSETHGVNVFNHDAGHVVPRGELNTSKMTGTVSWVAEKVIWRC